jgi:Ser/Thr protein kinase RdoA (MazF antagonist)
MNTDAATLAYQQLQPEQILAAVESVGFRCDGRLLALNSYENRVYQVGLEDAEPVVAKFYRPHRWADAAIQEEHDFAHELAAAEVPVVAPCRDPRDGATLHFHHQFRFAVFPRCGGRAPELDNLDHLLQLGRFAGRLHAVGAGSRFRERPEISIEVFGEESVRFLLDSGFIPADLAIAYRTLTEDLLRRVRACFERAGDYRRIRLHGDCHAGNVLWTDDGPHIVDLDDARSGPAVQDLWMFLSGPAHEQTAQLERLLEGYTQFAHFDARELHLVEALRTLRLMHYYAWLARRWEDPAFPRAFPWFNTQRCWEDHVLSLREQAALMDEPPLAWRG